MFVPILYLMLASLLAPGTTQEFNGYFNAAAGGNSDDSCSRILCHSVLDMHSIHCIQRLDLILSFVDIVVFSLWQLYI